MSDYTAATYGDRIAPIYDRLHPGKGTATPEVRALTRLAGGGRALELGIGTGRVALPLAELGVAVHGIDASTAMAAGLRAKPGGADIPVTVGDFADVPVDGTFTLIFAVFNTFFALTTQDAQVRCFRRVADHLSDDGVFLIEVFRTRPGALHRRAASGCCRRRHRQRVPGGGPPRRAPPARVFPEHGAVGVRYPALPGADSLRMAFRTGPDGTPRGPAPARTLERLDRRSVHRRQHQPHLPLRTRTGAVERTPFRGHGRIAHGIR